jgi:large subunit ribosomal protein L17
MRHRRAGRKLNRTSSHLEAMKRNLANSLFAHERIETTVPKAKELRPYVEKLITIAKKGSAALVAAGPDRAEKTAAVKAVHYRRLLVRKLGGRKLIKINDETTVDIISKLMQDIGARYQLRVGGYTRVLKLAKRRLGDATPLAIIELLPAGAPPPRKRKKVVAAGA